MPLGDYTVTFGDAPARSIAARFVDNGGPLEVAGTLVVTPAREYTFDALIKPRDGAPRQLIDGLNVMTADPNPEWAPPSDTYGFVVAGQPRNSASSGKYKPR